MYTKPKYDKVVFVPDPHAPYHDFLAVQGMIEFIKWFKPEYLIFLGDLIDCYSVSHFTKDPRKAMNFQDEVETANFVLEQIVSASPKSEKHFLKGNHEYRLEKYMWTRAAELSGLFGNKIENLLQLEKYKIQYHGQGRMIFRNTIVKHGNYVRKYSGYSARAEFEAEGMSGVSGHTHRLNTYYETKAGGDYVWMECGHLADPNQEYLEGATANWRQGFGVGFYKQNSKRFSLQTVPIVNHKAMFGEYEFYI